MAKFELPSGGWVELREVLTVKDRKAINGALKFQFTGDDNRIMTGDVGDLMLGVLLQRTITSWSFTTFVPADNPNKEIAEDVLTLEDWDFLTTETRPMLDQILTSKPSENPKK